MGLENGALSLKNGPWGYSIYPLVGQNNPCYILSYRCEESWTTETNADTHRTKGIEFRLLRFTSHVFSLPPANSLSAVTCLPKVIFHVFQCQVIGESSASIVAAIDAR
jgi:hypothetical protein